MEPKELHPLPHKDPVTGGELYVSELRNDQSGIQIRGKFEVPRYARLDPDQAKFLETFLRCRGMLNSVERELSLSYPTVRSRLDQLLEALGLTPVKDDRRDKNGDAKRKILEQLEQGHITAAEAKDKIKAIKG